MPRCTLLHAVVSLGLAFTLSARAEPIRLDEQSDIVIEESGPLGASSGLARGFLEKYLRLTLNRGDLSGPGTRVLFLLESEAARWQQLPPKSVEDFAAIDAFEVTISGEPRPLVRITGRTPQALGYGVVHFLENYLGVFWAMPGEMGTILPAEQSFVLEEGRKNVAPWVATRAMSGLALADDRVDVGSAQRNVELRREGNEFFLCGDYFKSLRLHSGAIHHNMIKIFPVEQCQADHPEVFPILESGKRFVPGLKGREVRGGRNAYQAWHPCYTNPKTLAVAMEKGREAFEAGRPYFSLGINDGQRVQCQCDTCRAVGWPQSYYQFVNRVADALAADFPPQMVGVLAYGDVGIPPKGLELRDNVLVNIAGSRKAVWETIAPAMGTYEYIYGAGYVIPNLPLDVIAENFRYYQTHRLQMYRSEFYPVWAFDAPKAYVVRRLLWDPNQDVYGLLNTFCQRTFGDAAEPMTRYYETLASIRKDEARAGQFTPVWKRDWPFRESLQLFECPPDLHERLWQCLNEAKQCRLTPQQQKWMRMLEAFTEFSDLYYEMYRLKEEVFAGRRTLDDVSTQVDTLQERRQLIEEAFSENAEWFAGSSVKASTLHDRPWPTLRLEQQVETARSTARYLTQSQVTEGGPHARTERRPSCRLVPLRKDEHPWYKTEQHTRMRVTSVSGGAAFRFETRPNARIDPREDPRHGGRAKAQWLHASTRDLAVDDSAAYVLRVNLTGRSGLVRVRVQGATRSDDRRKIEFAQCMVSFPTEEADSQRTVVLHPRDVPDDSRDEAPSAMRAQLHLLWRPDTDDASLIGDVTLTPITMPPQP